ncbi:flavodoxin family protein [Psychrobacillus sp. FSL K6-2684]|uniref:flavodoxin family protein n=1 Tax=unclassified Psychrobacillus TaxID=2636677 RepID=UPI001247D1BB|nr:flavodoxin family protein [Psychrobacillus sp. AK 1817]QEY20358.1 flavodoxin family protein [Psychrobacillus sp. AK 1817]
MKIKILVGSSRKGGNSELLADFVVQDIEHEKVYIKDLYIRPIEDLRHTRNGFQAVNDDYDRLVEAIMKSDVLIFATPIYWYSMSSLMKNMIDRFSQAIRDERYPNLREHLKTIRAIVVVVGGDDPRIKGLPLIQQFQYTFDFLNMPFSSYIIGEANQPEEILKDSRALLQAAWLNEKLKSELYAEEE